MATLEGQYFRKYGRSIVLSEQNLVDCSMGFDNQGCNGGLDVYAFNYVIANNGISTSNSYPVIHLQIYIYEIAFRFIYFYLIVNSMWEEIKIVDLLALK